MMRLAWLTDIHLNFLTPDRVAAFVRSLAAVEADAFVLSGDIGESHDLDVYLEALAAELARPVYFVLGNHDFYRGSIAAVRARVRELCSKRANLHWLPDSGVVPLTDGACLVGHDGWGDGRLGDYRGSPVELNDWWLIEELAGLDKETRLAKLRALGDEAADHFRRVLPDALERFGHVVAVTHVPPFRESCWYQGRPSNDEWLPHFSCKAVGDVLLDAMRSRPDRRLTVLCGHTHGAGEAQILPTLQVLTGGVTYGRPAVQRVMEVG